MKIIFTYGCIVVLLLTGCTKQKENAELTIYDVALEHIIKKEYSALFIGQTKEVMKIDSLYWKELISTKQMEDTVIWFRDQAIMKGKKATVEYRDTLEVATFLTTSEFSKYYLGETFVKDHFDSISLHTTLQVLYSKADITANDFKSKLISVNPYHSHGRILGEEVPAISFSRILLNQSGTYALLYYEHFCGVKCASGWMLYLKKEHREWKVVDCKETWIA